MKQWAHKVEQLQIHCVVCHRIARRILSGNPLLSGERAHLEHDVSAALNAYRGRIRDGVEARSAQPLSLREAEASEKHNGH